MVTTDDMLFHLCLLRDPPTVELILFMASFPCVSRIPRRQALTVEVNQDWAWKSWILPAPRCATAHGLL